MSFLNRFKNLIGLNEELIDEHEEQHDYQQITEPQQTYAQPTPVAQPVAPVYQQQPVVPTPQSYVAPQPTVNQSYNPQMPQAEPKQSTSPFQSDFLDDVLEDVNKKRRVAKSTSNNIIDFTSAPSNEMVIVEPKSLDDASRVVSLLRSKKAVIVSYMNSSLDKELRNAISNYICGAVFAIDGNQEIITEQGVFLFTPGNISISNLGSDQNFQRSVDKTGNNLFMTINDISNSKKKDSKDSKDTKAS